MSVERVGPVTGRTVNYQLKVDGQSVGRIRRVRQADPMIGAGRTYHTGYLAKRNPYDTGMSFSTQADAEAFLMGSAMPDHGEGCTALDNGTCDCRHNR